MADRKRERTKQQKDNEISRQISQESSSSNAPGCVYKVIFTGVRGVGKSSLFLRIRDQKWCGTQQSRNNNMNPDFCLIEREVRDETIKIQVWDTGGMDNYGHHNLSRSYYQGSDVIFYVYSCDDQESADDLRLYLNDANTHAPGAKRVLIRNKMDLPEQRTDKDDVRSKLTTQGYQIHFEASTSAFTGVGVDELIRTVAKYLVEHAKPVKPSNTFEAYDVRPKTNEKDKRKEDESSGCC